MFMKKKRNAAQHCKKRLRNYYDINEESNTTGSEFVDSGSDIEHSNNDDSYSDMSFMQSEFSSSNDSRSCKYIKSTNVYKNGLNGISSAAIILRTKNYNWNSSISLLRSYFVRHRNNFIRLFQSDHWTDKILTALVDESLRSVFSEAIWPLNDIFERYKDYNEVVSNMTKISVVIPDNGLMHHHLIPGLSSVTAPNFVAEQHGVFINAGSFIDKMCWAPIDPHSHKAQYLAVAVNCSMTVALDNRAMSGHMLQIYRCDALTMGTSSMKPPVLEFLLVHDWGTITDMSWSSQPLRTNTTSFPLIGHLALASIDGFVRILPIAKRARQRETVKVKAHCPLLCLRSTRITTSAAVFPTCLDWCKQLPDRVVVGYNSGHVALYIFEAEILRASSTIGLNKANIEPVTVNRVFDGPICSVKISSNNWRMVAVSCSVSRHAVLVDLTQSPRKRNVMKLDSQGIVGAKLMWPEPGDFVSLVGGWNPLGSSGLIFVLAQRPVTSSRKLDIHDISSAAYVAPMNVMPIGTRSGHLRIVSLLTTAMRKFVYARFHNSKVPRQSELISKLYHRYTLMPIPRDNTVQSSATPTCGCPPLLYCVHRQLLDFSVAVSKEDDTEKLNWQLQSMVNINGIAVNPNPGCCTWLAVSLQNGLIHLVPLTHFYNSQWDKMTTGTCNDRLHEVAKSLFDEKLHLSPIFSSHRTGRPRKYPVGFDYKKVYKTLHPSKKCPIIKRKLKSKTSYRKLHTRLITRKLDSVHRPSSIGDVVEEAVAVLPRSEIGTRNKTGKVDSSSQNSPIKICSTKANDGNKFTLTRNIISRKRHCVLNAEQTCPPKCYKTDGTGERVTGRSINAQVERDKGSGNDVLSYPQQGPKEYHINAHEEQQTVVLNRQPLQKRRCSERTREAVARMMSNDGSEYRLKACKLTASELKISSPKLARKKNFPDINSSTEKDSLTDNVQMTSRRSVINATCKDASRTLGVSSVEEKWAMTNCCNIVDEHCMTVPLQRTTRSSTDYQYNTDLDLPSPMKKGTEKIDEARNDKTKEHRRLNIQMMKGSKFSCVKNSSVNDTQNRTVRSSAGNKRALLCNTLPISPCSKYDENNITDNQMNESKNQHHINRFTGTEDKFNKENHRNSASKIVSSRRSTRSTTVIQDPHSFGEQTLIEDGAEKNILKKHIFLRSGSMSTQKMDEKNSKENLSMQRRTRSTSLFHDGSVPNEQMFNEQILMEDDEEKNVTTSNQSKEHNTDKTPRRYTYLRSSDKSSHKVDGKNGKENVSMERRTRSTSPLHNESVPNEHMFNEQILMEDDEENDVTTSNQSKECNTDSTPRKNTSLRSGDRSSHKVDEKNGRVNASSPKRTIQIRVGDGTTENRNTRNARSSQSILVKESPVSAQFKQHDKGYVNENDKTDDSRISYQGVGSCKKVVQNIKRCTRYGDRLEKCTTDIPGTTRLQNEPFNEALVSFSAQALVAHDEEMHITISNHPREVGTCGKGKKPLSLRVGNRSTQKIHENNGSEKVSLPKTTRRTALLFCEPVTEPHIDDSFKLSKTGENKKKNHSKTVADGLTPMTINSRSAGDTSVKGTTVNEAFKNCNEERVKTNDGIDKRAEVAVKNVVQDSKRCNRFVDRLNQDVHTLMRGTDIAVHGTRGCSPALHNERVPMHPADDKSVNGSPGVDRHMTTIGPVSSPVRFSKAVDKNTSPAIFDISQMYRDICLKNIIPVKESFVKFAKDSRGVVTKTVGDGKKFTFTNVSRSGEIDVAKEGVPNNVDFSRTGRRTKMTRSIQGPTRSNDNRSQGKRHASPTKESQPVHCHLDNTRNVTRMVEPKNLGDVQSSLESSIGARITFNTDMDSDTVFVEVSPNMAHAHLVLPHTDKSVQNSIIQTGALKQSNMNYSNSVPVVNSPTSNADKRCRKKSKESIKKKIKKTGVSKVGSKYDIDENKVKHLREIFTAKRHELLSQQRQDPMLKASWWDANSVQLSENSGGEVGCVNENTASSSSRLDKSKPSTKSPGGTKCKNIEKILSKGILKNLKSSGASPQLLQPFRSLRPNKSFDRLD